jgi:hypothetical protein
MALASSSLNVFLRLSLAARTADAASNPDPIANKPAANKNPKLLSFGGSAAAVALAVGRFLGRDVDGPAGEAAFVVVAEAPLRGFLGAGCAVAPTGFAFFFRGFLGALVSVFATMYL